MRANHVGEVHFWIPLCVFALCVCRRGLSDVVLSLKQGSIYLNTVWMSINFPSMLLDETDYQVYPPRLGIDFGCNPGTREYKRPLPTPPCPSRTIEPESRLWT
mmetsp:Transcript_13981/g.20461  ORF Transcript_13981/g.20461 Transcript_13981/m.20461 type:complete len:103 (+) Transcript_13981:154-462(+)